jgi:hypothetical protein
MLHRARTREVCLSALTQRHIVRSAFAAPGRLVSSASAERLGNRFGLCRGPAEVAGRGTSGGLGLPQWEEACQRRRINTRAEESMVARTASCSS